MTVDITPFKVFAEALAIGLLIGVERYKDRSPGDKKAAGMRTFALIALLGAICALLDQESYTLVTFCALLVLLGLGYFRQSPESLGSTTQVAGLLTFWLGFLVLDYEALAISAAIVTVTILASKRALHGFVKGQVSDVEFYDTLKFLVVVFVVLPLLPNRGMGPDEFFNPTQAWQLVILVSSISYAGYLLIKFFGGERGLVLSAVVGGVVSTTAVTVSLAERARKAPEFTRLLGTTCVMANAVQFPRLLVLILVVDRELGVFMAFPLLAMFLVGGVISRLVIWLRKPEGEEPPMELLLQNPYSFWPALKFALLFLVILLLAKGLSSWGGDQGVYLASAVSGLVDASAISLSVANLVVSGSISISSAAWAILIAVTANGALKLLLAITNGTWSFGLWLGSGLVAMLLTGLGSLLIVQEWLLPVLNP